MAIFNFQFLISQWSAFEYCVLNMYNKCFINFYCYYYNYILHYYISQVVRAPWLVNFAGRILLYGPLNLKDYFSARPINLRDILNIVLTSFSRSVLYISYGSTFFSVGLWPARLARTLRAWAIRLVRGMYGFFTNVISLLVSVLIS